MKSFYSKAELIRSVYSLVMKHTTKCKIELECYLFSQISNSQSYLAKFDLLANFKMNFNKEEGCASRKKWIKITSQFMIKIFEGCL